jgi:hypothetical protein
MYPANRMIHLLGNGVLSSANMVCLTEGARLNLSTAELVACLPETGEDCCTSWRQLLRFAKEARNCGDHRLAAVRRGVWMRRARPRR